MRGRRAETWPRNLSPLWAVHVCSAPTPGGSNNLESQAADLTQPSIGAQLEGFLPALLGPSNRRKWAGSTPAEPIKAVGDNLGVWGAQI